MTLKSLTEKWWFFMILFVAQFMLFPITSQNFDFSEIGKIIGNTLSNSIMGGLKQFYLFFQIPSIIILLSLIVLKNKVKKLFTIYVIISFILFSFLQNIGITEEFGFSIVSINVIMFLFVGYSWFNELMNLNNESGAPRNDCEFFN